MRVTNWMTRLFAATRESAFIPLCTSASVNFYILTLRALSRIQIEWACVVWVRGVWCVAFRVCVVFYGVLGALLRVEYMAGVIHGFWLLNPMFPTVTQLFVVDIVGL